MSKTLFLGCTVIDNISFVASYPLANVKVPALYSSICGGGPALNAAITHSFLGGSSTLATSLGEDHFFKTLILEELTQYHVKIMELCADPNYHIPMSVVVSAQDTGKRIIINNAQPTCTQYREFPDLFDQNYDLLLLDQHEYAFVKKYATEIEKFSGSVILDGGGWKSWSRDYLALVDIPIVSEYFYEGCVEEFQQECRHFNITQWAMTLGEKGIVYYDNGMINTLSVPKMSVVDTLGAGDIFHGAFCYYYNKAHNFVDSLKQASYIASYSCTHLGTRSWMKHIVLKS